MSSLTLLTLILYYAIFHAAFYGDLMAKSGRSYAMVALLPLIKHLPHSICDDCVAWIVV